MHDNVGAGDDRCRDSQLLRCDDCCDHRREPPDFDLSHHPAPALGPGIGLGIYNADGNPVDTCTAGWLVHDSTGQAGLLTAGHCDDGGGATYFNKSTGFQIAGWLTHKAYDGDQGEDADGTATPVGITIGAADSGSTIAELIGPWLKRWD